MYRTRQTTQAEIHAATAAFAAKIADLPMTVNSNGHGVHVRCDVCRAAWTHDRAYNVTALREHAAICAATPAMLDAYESVG